MTLRVNNLIEFAEASKIGKSKPVEVSVPLERGDVVLLRGHYYIVDGTFKDMSGKKNLRLFAPQNWSELQAWGKANPKRVKPIGTNSPSLE